MRHRRSKRHLSRGGSHTRAMLRNLALSVLAHQRVTTTLVKAKAVQPLVDRLITLGKAGDLHAKRRAASLTGHPHFTRHLFHDLAPRFQQREGGYTRILRLGMRHGDGAQLALIELTERVVAVAAGTKSGAGTAQPATAPPVPPRATQPAALPMKPAPKQPQPKPPRRRFLGGLRNLWGRRSSERGGQRGSGER